LNETPQLPRGGFHSTFNIQHSTIENRKSKIENRKSKIENRKSLPGPAGLPISPRNGTIDFYAKIA